MRSTERAASAPDRNPNHAGAKVGAPPGCCKALSTTEGANGAETPGRSLPKAASSRRSGVADRCHPRRARSRNDTERLWLRQPASRCTTHSSSIAPSSSRWTAAVSSRQQASSSSNGAATRHQTQSARGTCAHAAIAASPDPEGSG